MEEPMTHEAEAALLDLGEQMENIISNPETPAERRAKAYAALTLTKVLAPQWVHVQVTKAKNGPDKHERVAGPAGTTFGPRSVLEARLTQLITELV
jgi:hypothetical protein